MTTFAQLCGRPDFFNVYTQVNFKGGGTSTTESGIAKEFLPELKEITAEGKAMYDSGALSRVAEVSPIQQGIFDMIGGTGASGEFVSTSVKPSERPQAPSRIGGIPISTGGGGK